MSGAKTKISRQAESLLAWFGREARDLPWRRTRDPYAIWVSEIMLQQTQVKTVIPYWERWMAALPDIHALAKANPERIHKLWEGLGYYSRVRNLQRAARQILEQHQGKFPEQFEQVLDLPGIGRYTAGALCSIAFNQARPILDGNVIRVLTRVHGLAGDPKQKSLSERLWQLAGEWVVSAPGRHGRLNESLMELGALVCLPRDPRCAECPLGKSCIARRDERIAELPGIPRHESPTPRWFAAFAVGKGGRFLVVQRPPGVVNGTLWEFPNVELKGGGADSLKAGMASLGLSAETQNPLCSIKHSITRFRITLRVFALDATAWKTSVGKKGRWLTLSELEELAFPSAHRRILAYLAARRSKGASR